MQKFLKLSAFALLITSQAAFAQQAPTSLYIIAEEPGQDGQLCGIDKSLLMSSARAAMRYNRVLEGTIDEKAAILVVGTNTLKIGNLCVTNIDVSIKRFQYANLQGMGNIFSDIVFCDQSMIMSGNDHQRRISDNVKLLFESCLSNIRNYSDDQP